MGLLTLRTHFNDIAAPPSRRASGSAPTFRPVALPEPRRVLVSRLPSAAPFSHGRQASRAAGETPFGRDRPAHRAGRTVPASVGSGAHLRFSGAALFARLRLADRRSRAMSFGSKSFRGLLDTPSTLLPSEPRMLYPLSHVRVLTRDELVAVRADQLIADRSGPQGRLRPT